MPLVAYSSDDPGSSLPHDPTSLAEAPTTEFHGLVSYSSDDTPDVKHTPSTASQASGYVAAGGGETYGDWWQSAKAGMHGAGATAATLFGKTAETPEQATYWQKQAQGQREEEKQDIGDMTAAGQQGREGSFWSHPVQQTIEAAPGLVAMGAPAIVGGAMAGPPGAVAGAMLGGGWQGPSQVSDYTQQIMDAPEEQLQKNPDYAAMIASGLSSQDARLKFADATSKGLFAKSAVIGALTSVPFAEVGGGGAAKILGDKLVTRVLTGGVEGSVAMSAQGAAQTQVTGQAGYEAGIRGPPTPEETLQGGWEGFKTGLQVGAGAALLHRGAQPGQSGTSIRSSRDSGKQAKEEASRQEEAGAAGAPSSGAREPANPITPDIAAAAKGEPIVTPESNQQAEAVEQPAPVVQPTGVGAAEATGAPPAAPATPGEGTPPPPPGAQPAPAAAPAPEVVAPEPPSVIAAQHQALLDPNDPREAMIYNPKQQPIELTDTSRFGQTRLKDGRVVQYDKQGPSALTPQKVGAYARSDRLNEILQLSPVSKDEAVQTAASVAGEKPAVVTTTTDAGDKVKVGAATTASVPEAVAMQEATKGPGDTVQVENPVAPMAERFAKTRDENVAAQTAQVTPESKPLTIGEQLAAREAEKAAAAKATADAQAAERATRLEALKRDMNQQLATGPAPTDRVLRAEDAIEKETQARQAVAQEAVKGVTTEEEAKTGKHWTTGELAKRENANQIANEIMQAERNHPKPGEQPNDILARARAMVNEVPKGMHIPTEISEEGKHGPGMMLLREAKDLVAKDLPKQNKFPSMADYARFLAREGDIREGRLAEALEARRAEGKESAALGAPAEMKAEGVRPGEGGEHLAERSAEEEVIHREEEEERAKTEPEEISGKWDVPEDASKDAIVRKLEAAKAMARDQSIGAEERDAAMRGVQRLQEALRREPEGRARPTIEVKEGEHYTAPKAAVGFKVEKTRPKWKKLGEDDRQAWHRAGWDDHEIDEYVRTHTPEEVEKMAEKNAKIVDEVAKETPTRKAEPEEAQEKGTVRISGETLRPSRVTDVKTAIKETYSVSKYARGAPWMMGKLRDIVVKFAGDTPVYYLSDAEMERLMGEKGYDGGYHSTALDGKPVIIINADTNRPEAVLHEAFHDATSRAIRQNPVLRNLMERLRVEVLKNLPDMSAADRKEIGYFFKNHDEFLTGMMTNESMQRLLKGVKISDELARDIGIPRWRKMTMWEGALAIIRDALGLGPRDTSAIEAAMSLSEQLLWRDKRGAGDLMEATGRLANAQMEGWKGIRQAEEKTPVDATRSRARYSELADKITDAVKERIKDVPPGVHTVTEKMRALIDTPRDWMERAKERGWRIASTAERIIDHMGELGADREKILKLSTPVMDRLGRLYSENGNEFGKLAKLFVSSTIHGADARDDLGKGLNEHIRVNKKNTENSNLEHWDAIKGNPKDREDYKSMHPDTQALYNDTMDELKKMNLRVIEATRKSLGEKLMNEMGSSIPQERRDAVQKVIDRKELTPDELKEHGDDPNIRALNSYDAMAKRATLGAYFPLKRTEGTHYVGGEHEYDLPAGARRASNDEADPDYHRIVFDTRKEAFDFDPDLPTTPSIQHYIEDAKGNREYVSADQATSTPGTKYKQEHHVLVNNRDVRFVNGNVEGARVKREMEKEGMKNVSVQPRKNQEVWQYGVNSSHVTAIMKRLNKMDMTDAERAGLGDAIKHVAASSMPGSRLSRGFLHRDRTGGAGGDIIATLDMHRRTSAGLQAMAGHRNEIDAALEKMKQYVDDHPNHKDVGDMRQMVNMYDDRINNFQKDALSDINVNKNWNAIRAYTTLNDLVSPAFFLLHQLHIPLTVFPDLAARHGIGVATRVTLGVYRDMLGTELPMAVKAMGRAAFKAWRYNHQPTDFIDALKNEGRLSGDERSMIDWGVAHDFAHSTGIDFSQAYVSQRALDKFASKARNFSQEFIGSADAFNKVNSALMFHRAAIEAGMKGEEAYRYAWDSVARTQGQYTSFQRMGMFRNARMQTLLQYKQYPILMAKMIAKAMYNSFAPGVEWETRARALRTFGLMTLSAGTMSGVQGGTAYPIRLADDLLHLLGITDGWETHMDELRRSLASSMGPTGATALMDGLGGLAGIYAGHRGGISDPLGINYMLETAKSDSDWYKWFAGAPGGVGHNLITGLGGLLQGDPDVALKNLLPRIATDPIKAYEEYNHGVSTQRGAIISPPVSAPEAVFKALGLTTIEETHARELRASVGRERTEQQTERQSINKLWQSGDRAGAIAAVHKFNMAYPSQHITVASLNKLQKPTVAGYPETPKTRRDLEERAHAYGLQ